MHWSASLIGRPYAAGARGPDAFDCFGLVQFVWRERLGLSVPDMRLRAPRAMRCMLRGRPYRRDGIVAVAVADPAEFDAVYLTWRSASHHVGLWIGDALSGGVLHAMEGAGVVFQRRVDLVSHGLSIIGFVRVFAA